MKAALLLIAAALAAIAQRSAFEVASVKPNPQGDVAGFDFSFTADGGVTARNFSAWNLIRTAFNLHDLQMRGGPSWVKSQGYDIQAKPGASVARDQTLLMLQSLLAERFQLKFRRETQQVPSYVLSVGPKGSKLGPPRTGRARTRMGDLDVPSMTVASLCQVLEFDVGRPVVNGTGLDGSFSVQLQWASDRAPKENADPSKPSLFTALQEQLGLKLDAGRTPVELFMIESLERPSEN